MPNAAAVLVEHVSVSRPAGPGPVGSLRCMSEQILDVDLLAFENGNGNQRRAVVDGVSRSLATGFVYTSHDLSEDLLDTAYGMLREFFEKEPEQKQQFTPPGANGQTGYTGLLVETAASSDKPDWKEMLNWSTPIAAGHPLKRKFATAYPDQVLPESVVPGITDVLYRFHDSIADLQRRFLHIIAEGIGCHETFFDDMVADGPTLTRAIRYPSMGELPGPGDGGDGVSAHVWAAEHGDINLITALPRATAPGLQVSVGDDWIDAVAPDNGVIINTGIMLERLTNGAIPIGWHRVVAAPGFTGERYSVVQFCHPRPWTVLAPVPSCCTADNPQRFSAMNAADALDEVLYEINLVEDARRVRLS
jgi:isopenicillin N synthase-like dioxygenase